MWDVGRGTWHTIELWDSYALWNAGFILNLEVGMSLYTIYILNSGNLAAMSKTAIQSPSLSQP